MSKHSSRIRAAGILAALALAAGCTTSDSPAAPSATPPGSDLAAPATVRNLRCDGWAGGPSYSYYSVTAKLSAAGVPGNVLSFPTYSPGTPGSYRRIGTLVTNYPGWPQYRTWNVTGHANGVGTPGNDYLLLMPPSLPGPGGLFPAELHILFNHGAYGWWQVISTCAVS
jgi:hypothetical protein